jgi:fumarylacetoacetate (FAA) hydrolase family protein
VGYTRGIYLKSGDTVRISIDGLGTLINPVAADQGDGIVEH